VIRIDKRILNYVVIVVLSFITFGWTFWIFHRTFQTDVVLAVIAVRLLASTLFFKDYSLSWSKASQKTFLTKSMVYIGAFFVYMPFFYSKIHIYFFMSELFVFLFSINFLMYGYYYYFNRSKIEKTKTVCIYGAGKAGAKLKEEFSNSPYRVKYFIDDDKELHKRTIDGTRIISKATLKEKLQNKKIDLLVIAMPSANTQKINEIFNDLHAYFSKIQILPSLDGILQNRPYATQLKALSVTDLLARHPQDLDKGKIASFIKEKTILITGAGGSIGGELVRQCIEFKAKKLILLDHSEYNLYQITEEIQGKIPYVAVLQTILDKPMLERTFRMHKPEIVIHAAAYKHVPMVEENPLEAIKNNVLGTKHCIDLSIEHQVSKFILISTDKAVRPTNIMGATKRICELYAQNVESNQTNIVTVRFGNVLGSSGSVIPKFQKQIEEGKEITVTHPDVSRYFMLIPEACELVLQAAAIGKRGELLILDMGEPVKIVDLAKKMIELSGRRNIQIRYTGLRPGEKLHEELFLEEDCIHTEYPSITVAKASDYPIEKLNKDIDALLHADDPAVFIKHIIPEFDHKHYP